MKRQNTPETLLGERTTNYSCPVPVRSKEQIDRGGESAAGPRQGGTICVESSIANPKLLSDKVRQIGLHSFYAMTLRSSAGYRWNLCVGIFDSLHTVLTR